jgi:SAM-dependent methyltransferase
VYAALRRLADRKRDAWHAARADLLFRLLDLRSGVSILDLGGQDGTFMLRIRDRIEARITIADINAKALRIAKERGFATWALKEGEPLPYGDGAFDVVFCNSVIEHVTFPKDECINRVIPNREWVAESMRNQAAFAAEIRRVGMSYFVQTPHRAYPVEAHTWLPFVGWLPHQATVAVVKFSDRHWVKHCGYVDWNLLGTKGMRTLFPDASLYIERVLGLPKSLVAYRRGHDRRP